MIRHFLGVIILVFMYRNFFFFLSEGVSGEVEIRLADFKCRLLIQNIKVTEKQTELTRYADTLGSACNGYTCTA